MPIIDAPVHIRGSGQPGGLHRRTARFTAGELIAEMDQAGVDGAVLHPPGWDPGSNEIAIAAAGRYPDRFCILGWFPLDDPAQRRRIETWKQQPGMLGLRWSLTRDGQETWARGRHDGLAMAGGAGSRHAGRHHGLAVPAAVPEDRRATPAPETDGRSPGPRSIRPGRGRVRDAGRSAAAARLPNVAVKATGAPGYSEMAYPFRDIHDGLRRIYDAFGPDRFFRCTDLTRMPCSYRQCVTMFTEELPWLRGGDLDKVMGRGIADWLEWKRT